MNAVPEGDGKRNEQPAQNNAPQGDEGLFRQFVHGKGADDNNGYNHGGRRQCHIQNIHAATS